ncbi:M15 family metallopeptidase [Nocardioides limicola]|uniref:M15 family metallopeptidase n=1 Tax=Nocardioides limicola TaxID=2803368 RepID=UPI001EF02F9F|nr:M15 family metallopeptidase [Nocardioides sp. DJM-14]
MIRRHLLRVGAASVALLLTACTADLDPGETAIDAGESVSLEIDELPRVDELVVDPPGPLTEALLPADVLVYSLESLDEEMVAAIRDIDGVVAAEQLWLAQVVVEEIALTIAAVDPDGYRRFTPVNSAQLQEAWVRVAGGEMAIDPELGRRLEDTDGFVTLGNTDTSPRVHIGAYAPQINQIDAVVNLKWGEALGMVPENALLVSTGMTSPQSIRRQLQRIAGDAASVQILGPDLDTTVQQTAILTGGSVGQAVGTFSYQVLDGGRIAPDPAWVAANIRTEEVPILGRVTCHKVMLPQMRAAFTEIQARGLADKIHPQQYAGCYYPRFIANSTRLSMHSWGIAFDINVPGNQRGTVGEIDRTVVAIFKKWGFAWGGDWSWTDPMHFELAHLVEIR